MSKIEVEKEKVQIAEAEIEQQEKDELERIDNLRKVQHDQRLAYKDLEKALAEEGEH